MFAIPRLPAVTADAHARPHAAQDAAPAEGLPHRAADVREARAVEFLADPDHPGGSGMPPTSLFTTPIPSPSLPRGPIPDI